MTSAEKLEFMTYLKIQNDAVLNFKKSMRKGNTEVEESDSKMFGEIIEDLKNFYRYEKGNEKL